MSFGEEFVSSALGKLHPRVGWTHLPKVTALVSSRAGALIQDPRSSVHLTKAFYVFSKFLFIPNQLGPILALVFISPFIIRDNK